MSFSLNWPSLNWLKAPQERDVIRRWTVGGDARRRMHELTLPAPADPDRFSFLVLGDTGDSEASGSDVSPQDAVGMLLAADAALPGSDGRGELVLHLGDVVYMTGERRLYERNFRRPYAAFLTPESTVDDLKFRLPFLPVPGNHDYYDFARWGRLLTRVPVLGAGLRALSRELFAFPVPEGGSGMGGAFMQAFVALDADTTSAALPYRPGEETRLPNRYYRFTCGSVDFFALDSNTLAPPPPSADLDRIRAAAARRVRVLESWSRVLDQKLRRDQLALRQWETRQRRRAARDPERVRVLAAVASSVSEAVARVGTALPASQVPSDLRHRLETAARRWAEGAEDLREAGSGRPASRALRDLFTASEELVVLLRETESVLADLPDDRRHEGLTRAADELRSELDRWSGERWPEPPPDPLCRRIHLRSEEALDVQRELARERLRMRSRPEDHDAAQLRWLEESLAESERARPRNWRVLYLHHPLYSTIANHSEHSDVQAVRENLLPLIQGRVHLVLAGHCHAFEWLRTRSMPHTGFVVSGGGGQVALRRGIMHPRLFPRYRSAYDALRRAGVTECVSAGVGPAGADGVRGLLYHYVRVEVTPEALVIRPVGVRCLPTGYRREEPMPVFHSAELPDSGPGYRPRLLQAIEVRRGAPVRVVWA